MLIATLGGVTIGMVAMLGEYVIRILTQITRCATVHDKRAHGLRWLNIGTQRSSEVSVAARRYWPVCSHIIPPTTISQPERPEPKFFLWSSDHDEYHRLHFSQVAGLL